MRRKLDSASAPPKKKVKMASSAKKEDGSSKPKLSYEWTRTDPVTGERGKLFRKDIDYYLKQTSRRAKHIAAKKKKAKKKKEEKKEEKKREEIKTFSVDDNFADLTNRFNNQVCIVTGGGRGIGQAIAVRLAQEGAIVYILDKIRWLDTVKLLKEAYGDDSKNAEQCQGMKCDVTNLKQVKKCVEEIIEEHGYIDVLINAVCELDDGKKKAHEFDAEDLEKSMSKNFYSVFNTCKVIIPYMLEEGYGRIVSICSVDGKEGRAGHFAYSMSTAATIAATKTMGKEYAGTGVTVNCVAPVVDYTITKQGKKAGSKEAKKEVKKEIEKVPMGRAAEQCELSGLVAFIASEENTYTTGFCYDLTGGVVP